jgi:hypothetical protein
LFLLWGPLEEGSSSSPPPKPIRKPAKEHHHSSSKKEPLSVRFSDDICYDDDSSSSLDARYPGWDEEGGGGKIVKPRTPGLSGGELRRGVWFHACLKEFWVRESEAVFGVRRWRLFGTRVQ